MKIYIAQRNVVGTARVDAAPPPTFFATPQPQMSGFGVPVFASPAPAPAPAAPPVPLATASLAEDGIDLRYLDSLGQPSNEAMGIHDMQSATVSSR